jgi:hypothetical protein
MTPEATMPRSTKTKAERFGPEHTVTDGIEKPNVSHAHELGPHAHTGAWCSARYWCAGCRSWLAGPVCHGRKLARPQAAKLTA